LWDVTKEQFEAYNATDFDFDDIEIGDNIIIELRSTENFYNKSIKKGKVIHLKRNVHFTISVETVSNLSLKSNSNETIIRNTIICNDIKILYHGNT